MATPFEATLRRHASVPSSTFANVTYAPTVSQFGICVSGVSSYHQQDDPSTGDRTTPNRFDRVTGISSGNVREMGGLELDRITAKAVFNRYQSAWLGANHELRAGIQLERGEHRAPHRDPQWCAVRGQQRRPVPGALPRAVNRGGRADMIALFASDSIALNDRVTVNAGVRFDHSRASSQDVPAFDVSGQETDETIAGLGMLYTWNVVSPRLGVTAKRSADGRTMPRASYGRFNQGAPTGELQPRPSRRHIDDDDGVRCGHRRLHAAGVGRRPEHQPRTRPADQNASYRRNSVGVERQLTARLAASTADIRKSGANSIALDRHGRHLSRRDAHDR